MIDIEALYKRWLEYKECQEKRQSERRYYTYDLSYPESMGGSAFYVGKGSGPRINRHEDEARRGVSSPKCDVIRSIWAAGEEVVKRKRREKLTHQEALDHERELIREYGPKNLTNILSEKEETPSFSKFFAPISHHYKQEHS